MNFEHRNFEDQLRQALKRDPASADFKRRLMERLPNQRTRTPVWRSRRFLLAMAATLIAGIVIPATVTEARRERRERGIEARNQLITAISVTNSTLRHTKEMVRRTTARRS